PGFTDGFERRQPIQSLETLGEVVGVEECLDVLAKLVVAVVVVAPNSRLFDTVHPLDLPVRPRMIWLCQPMLNPSGNSVCLRNATARASSSALSTVERGTFGPIGAS